MPTYEYQCGTCGNRFEKFQSFSEEPVKICPECGSPVKKVFSPAGIIFKGSGWYINDSKKATNSASAPVSNGDKADKTESKPATESPSTSESKPSTETKPSAGSKSEAAA